ncbi:endonuclease/exonuclease/phosphatase family protein [Glaciibacter sp. 2TAF33]|uniref:endonuclease/exonuclease/phosphatase family protein n=1 Tax=Glaciibacter sp. 2TAF33 TaxID=3233015 RepID=UPI003F910574
MTHRFLPAAIALVAAVVLAVLTVPQLVGLQNAWVVAHIVSLRGLAVVCAAVAVVLLLVLTMLKPVRRVASALAIVLALFIVANSAILVVRGVGVGGAEADAAAVAPAGSGQGATSDDVTVLSWNTLGDAPGAKAIADLALEEGADIVALPETTEITGVKVAELMRDGGRPMWVHTVAFDLVSKARSTTLLISPTLGDYAVRNDVGSGPPGNTNVLPTVVATPVDGDGPTVIAVHAVAPIQWEMSNWRSDLDWLATQCNEGSVIMAGDFNATVDHMAGREASAVASSTTGDPADAGGGVLGACGDAGLAAGSGAVGTWPVNLPPLLGSPIDHVLSTADWTVRSMHVIESRDSAGSDHRPIVATLVPTAGG